MTRKAGTPIHAELTFTAVREWPLRAQAGAQRDTAPGLCAA
jgi:hypothetical protein